MNKCVKCGNEFPNRLTINGKKVRVENRHHCIKCLPIGVHPKKQFANVMNNRICSKCGNKFFHVNKHKKYCYNCLPKNSDTNKFKILNGKMLKCIICNKIFKYQTRLACTKNTCHSCIMKQRRLRFRDQGIKFLGGKCIICGYHKCNDALMFHHIDPRSKDFNISNRMTWNVIQKELKKCALLCANCHYELHAVLRTKDENSIIYKRFIRKTQNTREHNKKGARSRTCSV